MLPTQYLDGVRVVERPGLGSVLEAARTFEAGDLLLLETPLIVYGNNKQLVQAFVRLSDAAKAKVFDMKHTNYAIRPPHFAACDFFSREYLADVPALASRLNGALSVNDVARVVSVSQHNCCAFDAAGQVYSERAGPLPPKMALFYLGSKVINSCDPLAIYTSSVYPGAGAYVALRRVAEGEVISVNVSDTMQTTVDRRTALVAQRDFFCQCARCTGPDYASGMACERPGCNGTRFGFHRSAEDVELRDWCCNECGDTTPPDQTLYAKYKQRLALAQHQLSFAPMVTDAINELEQLVEEVIVRFSCTHALVIDVLKILSRSYCSYAIFLENSGDSRKGMQYRYRATKAGVRTLKVMECLGANCVKGSRCDEDHPPRVSKPETILWVCMDMLKCSRANRRPLLPAIEKYIPFMLSVYGTDDDDVRAVQDMLEREGRPRIRVTTQSAEYSSKAELAEQAALELLALEDAEAAAASGTKKKSKNKKQGHGRK